MNTQNNNHIGIVEIKTETAVEATLQPNAAETGPLSLGERVGVRGNGPSNPKHGSKPRSTLKPERRFTGKVARLPHLVRIEVNSMLDDGCSYRAIAAKLQEMGYPGFFYQNIQRWNNGGYQALAREPERCV